MVSPVVLVDLSGCFWRDYYGTKSDVEAYRTSIDRLDRYRRENPRTVVCCEGRSVFRFQWFEGYKANRSAKPEEAKEALRAIITQASTWGIPVLSVDGYEADDVIATLTKQAWLDDVLIVSSDKDLMALLAPNVKMVTKGGTVGPTECFEKVGVWPNQIRDWLALTGDAADNIPGCPNMGPARARDLLQKFGDLNTLLVAANADVPEANNPVLQVRGVGTKTLRSLQEWDPSLALKLVTLLDQAPVDLESLWGIGAPQPPSEARREELVLAPSTPNPENNVTAHDDSFQEASAPPAPPIPGLSSEAEAAAEVAHEPEVQQASVTPLVRYHVTKADIEKTRASYAALSCDTAEGYEETRKALAVCRNTRVRVEKRRKELKADSLDWGRRVDAAAKDLTTLIESIENPLQAKKDAVDAERERVKREAEEAARRALEAADRAAREADEARVKAEREAEQAKLREEQARLDADRRALEAQRAELERGQADLRAAREKAEREEFERQAKIRAEADAKAQAERDRVAAEEARVAEAERQAENARRLEALKPDREKMRSAATAISALRRPAVASTEATSELDSVFAQLASLADRLNNWGAESAATAAE